MASSRQELQRGQRLRKVSEAENDSKTKTNTIRVEAGNSMFYTKVPLHRIDTNVRSSGNVDQTSKRTSAFTRTQASVRIKKMAAYHDGSIRFPKLNECAHFHYENVEFGQVQVLICNESDDEALPPNHYYIVQVTCQKKKWTLKRCYEDFRVLDKHLHRCIFDRRYSQLVELPKGEAVTGNHEAVRSILSHYLSRFSQIAGNMINCAPVLNWMELDNHGNHLIVSDESAINIPAVAAAHVVKRYVAQASDELSLEVGEFVSVIDMPPVEDTNWWRGKKGFEVGFFPSQCVQVIGGKVPTAVISNMPKMPKPVLRKHGKLITFLRSFMLARPAKRRLKQSGILRERVYGCDLGEHLMNSEHDIPPVLKICTDFIETHGIVDGIYRLSGVASNIQRLRQEFDSENDPDMADYINDIHSVSSVLKLYFRELPNPLLTYQLYDKFAEAIAVDEDRLLKITDVIQQLPPPHYRTVEYLMKHLSKMSTRQDQTGMHSKNLAIVWAPNLLRSREIETGLAAFMEIRVQSIVVEYLIRNVHMIFSDKVQSQLANNEKKDISGLSTPGIRRARPKSLILSTPTKLLSLEEARARSGVQSVQEIPVTDRQKFIEVGGGPAALPKQYHTVIDLPYDRKKHLAGKSKKSPSGWKALFRSRPGVDSKRKLQRKSSVQPEKDVSIAEKKNSLRSVRSAESLVSGSDTSDGANSLFFQEADVSPRRGSESSLPKATSHNSFFEGDSALAAMATNAMATPPESMFAKPARRPRVPQRQRSHSENPPVDIDVEFALGGVELRKKRMRHSDTPIRSGMIVRDVDYLAMSGKSGSPSKERNRNGLWLDGSTQALPRSKRLSDQSPTNSNRSSRSSQSSNSPESKSERHRVSAVGVEETSPSKSRQPKESSKNRISVTVELLSTTELDSESQQKRNSKNIDDSNSGDNEQKVPVITKTEPSHETVTLNVRIPPYVPGHRIIRLPDQERVALATEDNFRLTPYNTLESNMSLRNFDQSNDEELVKTPTATDNSFNLETVMSQFDSMREKYLRQGSVSPALSNSDDGMPSPQPDRVSPVFLESYVPSMSNPTNASIALDSDKTGGSNLSPTYVTVSVEQPNGAQPSEGPIPIEDNLTFTEDKNEQERPVGVRTFQEKPSETYLLESSDQTNRSESCVSEREDPGLSCVQWNPPDSKTVQVDPPELSVTQTSLAEMSVESVDEPLFSQKNVIASISLSQESFEHDSERAQSPRSSGSVFAEEDTPSTQSTTLSSPLRIPPFPLSCNLSPSLSPTSPTMSSPSPTSPELKTPPPLPSPPYLRGSGSFTKSSTSSVFTFDERHQDTSILSPSSVISSASYSFPTTLEISYKSGSSSSVSSRSTSSSASPRTPRSPSSPVRSIVLSGSVSPSSPRSPNGSSLMMAEKPPSSPRRSLGNPSPVRWRTGRRSSQEQSPSPTDIAYAASDERMKCVAEKMSTHHDDLAMYESHQDSRLERMTSQSDSESERLVEQRSPSYYENITSYDTDRVFTQETDVGQSRFPQGSNLEELSKRPSSDDMSDDLPLGESRLSVMTVASQYDNLEEDSSRYQEDCAANCDNSQSTDYVNISHNDSYSSAIENNQISPTESVLT